MELLMDKENIFDREYTENSDNLFDGPTWNPGSNGGGGHSRGFEDIAVREAKRAFSRFGLALFIYLLAANAVILLAEILLPVIFPDTFEKIRESYLYTWGMNTLSLYIIAFPILFLIVNKLPSAKREKKNMKFKEFIATFAVAQLFMYIGNYIGVVLNSFFSTILGHEITNQTSELIENSPIWIVAVMVVVLAPIFEELIFRKLLIDKLSRFGDTVAIIASAVAFGLFHGNFYQFFYAAALGALLAYIYVKTGKVRYTVLMHALINLVGSIAVFPVIDAQEIILSFAEGSFNPQTAEEMREFINAIIIMSSYSIIQLTLVGIGVYALLNAVRAKMIKVERIPEIRIPRHRITSATLGNTGAILFIFISALTVLASIFVV